MVVTEINDVEEFRTLVMRYNLHTWDFFIYVIKKVFYKENISPIWVRKLLLCTQLCRKEVNHYKSLLTRQSRVQRFPGRAVKRGRKQNSAIYVAATHITVELQTVRMFLLKVMIYGLLFLFVSDDRRLFFNTSFC